MRALFVLFAFFLCGCAVSVKESYRNPDFKHTFDKISIAWIPAEKHEYHKKFLARGGYVFVNDPLAMSTARKHLHDLQTRTRTLLYDGLAHYETDVVDEPLANYMLQIAPEKSINIACVPDSCQSSVVVRLTMKEKKTDSLLWSSAIKVTSSRPPYTRTDMDGKQELVTPDTTQELVDSVIEQWNKYQLLPARLASPRTRLPLQAAPSASNTLDQTDLSYEKLINWVQANNKWGRNAAVVDGFRKDLETAVGAKKASWKLGWGLTKTGKAYAIVLAAKHLEIVELTPEEAALRGFRETRNIFTVE